MRKDWVKPVENAHMKSPGCHQSSVLRSSLPSPTVWRCCAPVSSAAQRPLRMVMWLVCDDVGTEERRVLWLLHYRPCCRFLVRRRTAGTTSLLGKCEEYRIFSGSFRPRDGFARHISSTERVRHHQNDPRSIGMWLPVREELCRVEVEAQAPCCLRLACVRGVYVLLPGYRLDTRGTDRRSPISRSGARRPRSNDRL